MIADANNSEPKPLVLCLGSDIISDDGFGTAVAARLSENPNIPDHADVYAGALTGLALLDLMRNRSHVLIVDAIDNNHLDDDHSQIPGTLTFFPANQLVATSNLVGSHQLSLPVTMSLGYKMGYKMPHTIDVLACHAKDLNTLCEKLTPAVESAVPVAVCRIERWIEDKTTY